MKTPSSLLGEAHHALDQREVERAVALFDQAQRRGADPNRCAAGRWQCWMLLKEFEQAWQESDAIRAANLPDPHRLWDGQPIDGKQLIVRCLHGFGDAIQFARYFTLLQERAGSLTVEVAPKLLPLMSEAGLPCEVITWGEAAPAVAPPWDQQIEVMELPYLFRTTAATVPRRIPYLKLAPERLERAREHLPAGAHRRIGLLCTASAWDPSRSIQADLFSPLLNRPGCRFYGLNCEPDSEEAQTLSTAANYVPLPDALRPIADTAAWIAHLDLVLTVDSMTAHLAGSTGKPVWLMLPFRADWRWGLDQTESLWYPQMRIFRQQQPGDWQAVLSAVEAALDERTHAAP